MQALRELRIVWIESEKIVVKHLGCLLTFGSLKQKLSCKIKDFVVGPAGLEPATRRL